MKIIRNIIALVVVLPLLAGCQDFFSPPLENNREKDDIYNDPSFAQGILGYAYAMLPYSNTSVTDVATDDAVTNDRGNSYLSMATGSWAVLNNPMTRWQSGRAAIQYVNVFLDMADDITWAKDEKIHAMYADRLKGEAYAMRALNMYYLLMNHGGWTSDGKLLGIPIVDEPQDQYSDFNVPRNTFQECIDFINADIEKAVELLPLQYENITSAAQIPAKYQNIGITNPGDYNRVNGVGFTGRIDRRIAEAIRAQANLLAASPAYSEGTTVTWAEVAGYAATVLDRIGGPAGLSPTGGTWYMQTEEIKNLGSGENPAEILWRSDRDDDVADYAIGITQEKNNFPPTLYGSGRINPTQNLVDAFPMANGYPITDQARSGYDPNDPYSGRDPRLSEYVIYNGTRYKGAEIITGAYGTDNNALNRESTSTRTGYYLRKLLREDCDPNPQNNLSQWHYTVRIRYTELFLIYAEAANEAFGPTGVGNHGYSAYDVIKEIRRRALQIDEDPYLESIKNDQDKMRELIRNECRLELCFENFRFWDLRRWKDNLTETARGMEIDRRDDGTLEYNPAWR